MNTDKVNTIAQELKCFPYPLRRTIKRFYCITVFVRIHLDPTFFMRWDVRKMHKVKGWITIVDRPPIEKEVFL